MELVREFSTLEEHSRGDGLSDRTGGEFTSALDDMLVRKLKGAGFSLIRKQIWKDLDGQLNTNIYVVLPSLRGDHTEAMLIGAPKSNLQGSGNADF